MLSFYPELFSYSFFAPTIIRIALSAALVSEGTAHIESGTKGGPSETAVSPFVLGFLKAGAGAFLLIGFLVQPFALIMFLIALTSLLLPPFRFVKYKNTPSYYGLVAAGALSLLLLGPGAFAFDLPL